MKREFIGAVAAAIAFASIVPAVAQQRNVRFSQDGRPERLFRTVTGLNDADRKFIADASAANLTEIKTSEIALRKSNNSFVKEFAQEMIHEHTLAQEELKQVAARKGASVPQDLPAKNRAALMKLERLNGAAFDSTYQKIQKDGHAETSMKFKSEIRRGHDQDILSYATKMLPAVTMHYKMMITKQTMMGDHKMNHGM